RLGLLRDGRLVRLRGRQVRRLDEGGRAPAPAARPRGPWQHADRRRRLLLPRPDRDGGPAGAAPVASAAAGAAAAPEHAARVAPGRAAPAPAAAGARGGGSGPDRAGLVAEDRMTARSMAGKVVVVTGASSGVGRATVRALAERGAKVGLIARGL